MRFDTTAACLFTLAISSVTGAHASTGETAWVCRVERDASVCESSFETLLPVPGLDEGTETGFFVLDAVGHVIVWLADLAAGTETGFLWNKAGMQGSDAAVAKLDLVPSEDIPAGTEIGFRYYVLAEWGCTVEMKPGAPEAPGRAHCTTPTTRLVAAPR